MNSVDTNILVDETYCSEALNFDNHHITPEEKHMERWFVFALQAGMNGFSVPTNDQQTLQQQDTDKWELARQEELRACMQEQQHLGTTNTITSWGYICKFGICLCAERYKRWHSTKVDLYTRIIHLLTL